MKNTIKKSALTTRLSLLCLGVSGLLPPASSAFAQEAEDAAASEEEAKKPGYYTESFHIVPELQFTGYYDDNIYATDRLKESDYVFVFTPMIKADSLWDKHSLKASAGANLGRYAENSDEDYDDLWLEADGTLELAKTTSIFGGAGYSKKHEPRDSKEGGQSVREPTTYDVVDARLGFRQNLGDYTLRAAVTQQTLDYDNIGSPGEPGSLYNDDRDRTVTGLGMRLSKRYDRQTLLYAQGFLNERDYDESQDQDGFNRDSDGYTAALGITRNFGRNSKIDAYLGVLSQDYDDPRFDSLTEPTFAASLRWYPADTYKLTASLNRSLNETTEYASSGYLYTKFDLQLDKKLFKNVVGYVSYGYGLAEFQDVGREDVIHSLGLGANYYMTPTVLISAGYSYINNDSNDKSSLSFPIETYDYERNLFLISAKVKFSQ